MSPASLTVTLTSVGSGCQVHGRNHLAQDEGHRRYETPLLRNLFASMSSLYLESRNCFARDGHRRFVFVFFCMHTYENDVSHTHAMVASDHHRRIHVNTYLHAHRTRVSLIIMMSIMLDIAIMATGDSPSDSRARTHMSRCLHVKFGAHTQPQGMSPRGADG